MGLLVEQAYTRAEALESRSAEILGRLKDTGAAPGFAAALRGPEVAVISEIKRKSPSKGDINPGIAAREQALAYAQGGARALSVLTEPHRFGGKDEDIEAAKASGLPLLKKDFHVSIIQLAQAKVLGASAALLIARAVSPEQLVDLAAAAHEYGVEALIEVRDESELETALRTGAKMIGVNNRNLETLEIDPDTFARLAPMIPPDRIAIYESGVKTIDDVKAAARAGADAVLVGSTVSAASDPAAAVRSLTGVPKVGR